MLGLDKVLHLAMALVNDFELIRLLLLSFSRILGT